MRPHSESGLRRDASGRIRAYVGIRDLARPELMISHTPGFMFVTDVPIDEQKRSRRERGSVQATSGVDPI